MPDSTPSDPGAFSQVRRGLPRRLRAAGIHLTLSLAIFAVALYLILVHWYPGFHFAVDGGWQGVRIMVGVDLVLGPALTLVVFNPFKARRLIVFDLTCIGLTQLAALIWGFYAVHAQHPVAVTFYDGAFFGITAEPIAIEKYPADLPQTLSDRRPALIYVAPPKDDDEAARAAIQEAIGSVGLHEDPFFFRRFDEHWAEVKPQAVTAEAQAKAQPAFAAALPEFLARHGGKAADYAFFPYRGRYGDCTLAFTPAGEPIGEVGCARL